MGGGSANLEEGRAGVEKVRHPFARRQLAARRVAGKSRRAAAGGGDEARVVAELEAFVGKTIRFQAEEQYSQEQYDVVLL